MSLYAPDANSAIAVRKMRSAKQQVLVTALGELEVLNAFRLRVYQREANAAQAQISLVNFQTDLRAARLRLCPLPEHVFERARYLSEQTATRLGTATTDLLHVASALELQAEYFYSFDNQQKKLARAVGLKMD